MENILTREQPILPSLCDSDAKLSFSSVGGMFMDMAMCHAESLGIGFTGFNERGLFWVAAKTKIRILKDVNMAEMCQVSTWPEKEGMLRCNRDYEIVCGGETRILGKTEWAIIEAKTHTPQKSKGIYPEGLTVLERVSIEEPFLKLKGEFEGEPIGKYTARSVDIDYGMHINNVAYIRAIEGLFPAGELRKRGYKEFEIHYKNPSFEGSTLSFYARENEGIYEIKALDEEGKIIVLAALS